MERNKAREVDYSDKPDKGESIMKSLTHLTLTVLFATMVLVFAAKTAMAQDPVKVDPKHYKVDFENDQVRVLRITYGPHEKSVMHEHPAGQVIYLTDAHVKFTLPDGKSQDQRLFDTGEFHRAGVVVRLDDVSTRRPRRAGEFCRSGKAGIG